MYGLANSTWQHRHLVEKGGFVSRLITAGLPGRIMGITENRSLRECLLPGYVHSVSLSLLLFPGIK